MKKRNYLNYAICIFMIVFFIPNALKGQDVSYEVLGEFTIESLPPESTVLWKYKIEKIGDEWYIKGRAEDLKALADEIGAIISLDTNTIIINSKKEHHGFEIMTDQDVFASNNMDRDYTMGLRFLWYGKYTNKNTFILPIFRKNIDKGFTCFLKRNSEKYNKNLENFSMDFGESGFTPYELRFDFVDSTVAFPYSATGE